MTKPAELEAWILFVGRVWRASASQLLHQGKVLVSASQNRHSALRLRDPNPSCRWAVHKHEDCYVVAVKKGLSGKDMIFRRLP